MAFNGELGHLAGIESPWGNAGGVVKTVEDTERMARTGVGWIEAGSYTLEPRVGNSLCGETVYWHNPTVGSTYNSLGMPNKGMDEVEKDIPEMAKIAHKQNKKLIVNVAPVAQMPSTRDETYELVSRAYSAGADAVLVNAGCPNVISEDGGRHELLSRDSVALGLILGGVGRVRDRQPRPVFLRTSPLETLERAQVIAKTIISSQSVSAVFTPNTWPGQTPLSSLGDPILEVPGCMGGKSGPIMAEPAQIETALMIKFLKSSRVDVVRSSGIVDAEELGVALRLGAVAGAGTTFYYESSNGWVEDTDKLLSELAV